MCLYPKLIPNPKYKKTKKNGGVIPPINDKRVTKVPIGCQRCIECMNRKAGEWKVRLMEEIKTKAERSFVTLTFSNEAYARIVAKLRERNKQIEGYALDNWVATYAVRHFLERWRKKYKVSLRHWLVTELGHNGTENIHIHGIVWSRDLKEIREKWAYGYVWPKDEAGMKKNWVNEQTIEYITKYVTKTDHKHKAYKPIILTSAGIGKGYERSFNGQQNKYEPGKTKETYTDRRGFTRALPIYYRNKIYTEEERERLWIEKLDKQERWVLGVKIKVHDAKGEAEYWRALKTAQQKNARLGYGSDHISWEQTEYEGQLRKLKQEERIQAAEQRRKNRCHGRKRIKSEQ